jgi:RNA polymerase III subunit RPC82 helix-turn-helix domain
MSKYSTQLAGILVREFFGPTTAVVTISAILIFQSVVDVLLRNGRLPLQGICRSARLPEKIVSEALTVLIQHGLIRWASVEEGPAERTFYECFFEDVYPLVRYGKAIQLTEKITGSMEVFPLCSIILKGRPAVSFNTS